MSVVVAPKATLVPLQPETHTTDASSNAAVAAHVFVVSPPAKMSKKPVVCETNVLSFSSMRACVCVCVRACM
jgi:hypothetical protein